ncbi:MAG: AmmeMemoRadiSam system protein B [Candidatus Thermoplasmatota archaeon]|nr:AmmeMemoRadiSam system protein B [Candidatus Thermoplasmatota archaeon]
MIGEMIEEAGRFDLEGEVIGIVAPHAGYVYSGPIASISYRQILESGINRFLVVGPNHEGYPWKSTTTGAEPWETPLGKCSIDVGMLEHFSGLVMEEPLAGRSEHSIEVQLPFLQTIRKSGFTFLPVFMGDQGMEVAREIGKAAYQMGSDFLFIASSDLTHYEREDVARNMDTRIIEKIVDLDIGSYYEFLAMERASACGYGAIASLMEYTVLRGGRIVKLVYGTSAETSGDYNHVVGYPSLVSIV